MKSLDLHQSNQYILLSVISSCFRFSVSVYASESPVKMQPKILDNFFFFFWGSCAILEGVFLCVWLMLREMNLIRWLLFSIFKHFQGRNECDYFVSNSILLILYA